MGEWWSIWASPTQWNTAEKKEKKKKEKPSWWKCPHGPYTSHLSISQLPSCWSKPICLLETLKRKCCSVILEKNTTSPLLPCCLDSLILKKKKPTSVGRAMQKADQVNLGLMLSPAGSGKPHLPSAIKVPCHGKGTLSYLASHLHFPHIRSLSSICLSAFLWLTLKPFSWKCLVLNSHLLKFRPNRARVWPWSVTEVSAETV